MFLRSESGSFVNLDHVLRLVPQREKDSDTIIGWKAYCADGKAVVLDASYAAHTRLEKAIGFMPPDEERNRSSGRRS